MALCWILVCFESESLTHHGFVTVRSAGPETDVYRMVRVWVSGSWCFGILSLLRHVEGC